MYGMGLKYSTTGYRVLVQCWGGNERDGGRVLRAGGGVCLLLYYFYLQVQLHKLCAYLVGRAAGGSDSLVSSHYDSALKLLTGPAAQGRPGREEEQAQVDRLVKALSRRGREREAAQLSALHQKLGVCSRGILRWPLGGGVVSVSHWCEPLV